MNTADITASLTALFSELVDGAPKTGAYMLNRGDPGMLRSLDRLSAVAASAKIAAHVDHVRYGLSLMNRWANGEPNPFATADWNAAWRRTHVSDAEWADLRGALRDEAHRWLQALGKPREVDDVALNGMIGSIAHLAYHLGAIRQIDQTTRGPAEPQLNQ
jgi:hypothetical protein